MDAKKEFKTAMQGSASSPSDNSLAGGLCRFYAGVFRAFYTMNCCGKPKDPSIT